MPRSRPGKLLWRLVVLAAIGAHAGAVVAKSPGVVPVKLGLDGMSKAERATLWQRVEEYASVDALEEFCGRKLNLQRRTWAAISPCVETSSLRRVAAVFKAKKAQYMKAWETAHGEAEKKKALCDRWQAKLAEYARIIDSHIAEADTMCRACLFC